MNASSDTGLEPAEINWDGATPCQPAYGDAYFSRDDGAEEARHVFLEGNRLTQRFTACRHFAIGELGFGSGLNFLATWALWRRRAAPGARLYYVGFEKHPMPSAAMRATLARWPELAALQPALLARLPLCEAGYHRIDLDGGRIGLLLAYGDAADALRHLRGGIDAWYFDGFAPDRNPALWSPAIFAAVARRSNPGASFATYTAAGHVRRALAGAGFTVEKRRGHGRKREMLCGHIDAPPADPDAPPWTAYPAPAPGPVQVIGGGLAGACTARTLAEAGRAVTVVDDGTGASGRIPAMLLRAYPEARTSPSHRIYSRAWQLARQRYPRWCQDAFASVDIATPLGPQPGGVLQTSAALAALLNHPRIRLRRDTAALNAPTEGLRILCTAGLPTALQQELAATLTPVAGQAVLIDRSCPQVRAEPLQMLPQGARCLLGSSYRPGSEDLAPRATETEELLAAARPWTGPDTPPIVAEPTGLRRASGDHLPLVGPCPDGAAWRRDYAELRHGRPQARYPAARLRPGLWLNLAHGSRGATRAPLAAELIAAALDGTPLPLEAELLAALHPGRFLIRRLKRAAPGD